MSQVEERKMSVLERAKEKVLSLTSLESDDSKTKLVRQMKMEIRKARKAGRSWKEIAAAMAEAGVQVSRTILATECSTKVRGGSKKTTGSKGQANAEKRQIPVQTVASSVQVDGEQQERRRPTIKPDRAEL